MDENLKRNIIVGVVCLFIGAIMVWVMRPPKVVTKTEIKEVIKTEVKKVYVNRFINRVYDRETGRMISETITDNSEIGTASGSSERVVEKLVEKPVGTTWIITAGYSVIKGQFVAGAGITLFNRIDIQVINPVAINFEPIALLSLRF